MKSKLNLFWIIPEIIGSIGIGWSAIRVLELIGSPNDIGIDMWIFSLTLIMIVIKKSLDWFNQGTVELKKVFEKK